jgi:hypothetical protein
MNIRKEVMAAVGEKIKAAQTAYDSEVAILARNKKSEVKEFVKESLAKIVALAGDIRKFKQNKEKYYRIHVQEASKRHVNSVLAKII